MSTPKRSVHLPELAAMAGLTPDEINAIDAMGDLPPSMGVDSEGRWWIMDEAEVWAETFRRLRASFGKLPTLGLTAADISWIKWIRHESECGSSDGPCGQNKHACQDWKRLMEAHEKNRKDVT